MKPEHVKRFEESLQYPEYTEEQKKRGLNDKGLDFMCLNPMYWMVFLPSAAVIGMGLIPFIVMFIFFEKPEFLKP